MIRGVLLAFLLAAPARADIFVARHADKRDPKDDASKLSRRGLRRAEDLRRVLASVPLKAVYCTEYERSRQTAAPIAAAHGLAPTVTPYNDLPALLGALLAVPAKDDVLVIAHSDTIPELLRRLGQPDPVTIGPQDYDNLFVVALRPEGARVHRLHYGEASRSRKK